MKEGLQIGSRAVHAGQESDPHTGAVIPCLSLSTTFAQSSASVTKNGYDYSRSGNPTRKAFETAVASLEGGKYGFAFSSGSAVTSTITAMLKTGAHIVCVNDVYGGTFRYFDKVAIHGGIEVSFIDMFDPTKVAGAIKPNTRLVWIETPTNPTLRLVDIKAVADIVHKHKDVILIVDNTFMSPIFQNPLKLGADVVVHSVTKYINGHSDVVMGCAVTNSEALKEKFAFYQNSIGAVPSPFDCFMANRGLKTLHLRMARHQENALAVGKFLEASPFVERVLYPGLPSHKQHDLAKKQSSGFGGMLSFYIKGGKLAESNIFLQNLTIFTLAESLGGVESLAELPSVMTHASLTPEGRQALGVTDNMIRLSCGVEDTVDLVNDIEHALAAIGKMKK